MNPTYEINILAIILPYLFYYIGIFIRRYALPNPHEKTPLYRQLLIGIPVSLITVTPMAFAITILSRENLMSFLISLGYCIENGMLVNQTIVKHLTAIQNEGIGGKG